MVGKSLLLEVRGDFLSGMYVPSAIPSVVGIIWVVWVIIFEVEIEAIVEAVSSPVSALIPVDIFGVVAKSGSIVALITALPSTPELVQLRLEGLLSTSADHILASPV